MERPVELYLRLAPETIFHDPLGDEMPVMVFNSAGKGSDLLFEGERIKYTFHRDYRRRQDLAPSGAISSMA